MKLISEQYRKQNRLLHQSGKNFGHRGHRHLDEIRELMERYECKDVLDYGCGKATLSKQADFLVVSYDPAVPKYEADPPQCDAVVSTDVLEHIEPELIDNVLRHIRSKMVVAGYFVINTHKDRSKTLPDGTNPHRLIRSADWWTDKVSEYFTIENIWQEGQHIHMVVT